MSVPIAARDRGLSNRRSPTRCISSSVIASRGEGRGREREGEGGRG